MKDGRLQLRIEKDLLKRAKKIAKQNGLSLSQMVSHYLRTLLDDDKQKVQDDDGVRQI